MNSASIEIKIPATIADLPLGLTEKVVLAHIARFPGSSNTRLAKLIGGTRRGAESLVRRLRNKGYIEPSGKGRARRHYLTFHVEYHTECGNEETTASNVNSHKECGVQPSTEPTVEPTADVSVLEMEIPLAEDYEQTLTNIKVMFDQKGIFPETIF